MLLGFEYGRDVWPNGKYVERDEGFSERGEEPYSRTEDSDRDRERDKEPAPIQIAKKKAEVAQRAKPARKLMDRFIEILRPGASPSVAYPYRYLAASLPVP